MADPRSPHETSDLLASFHTGYLKRISHQIVAMRAEQRSAMDSIRSTTDTHLVLTGQVLEALRVMGKTTEAPPSGLMQILASKWRVWAADFALVHKLLVAMRAVGLSSAAYTLWVWLGWLVNVLIGR
jgi:hypothetical protein